MSQPSIAVVTKTCSACPTSVEMWLHIVALLNIIRTQGTIIITLNDIVIHYYDYTLLQVMTAVNTVGAMVERR